MVPTTSVPKVAMMSMGKLFVVWTELKLSRSISVKAEPPAVNRKMIETATLWDRNSGKTHSSFKVLMIIENDFILYNKHVMLQ